jgi:hypothetical protein
MGGAGKELGSVIFGCHGCKAKGKMVIKSKEINDLLGAGIRLLYELNEMDDWGISDKDIHWKEPSSNRKKRKTLRRAKRKRTRRTRRKR